MIARALYTRLDTVSALESISPDMRRPNATLPCCVYSMQSTEQIDGTAAATGWEKTEAELRIIAASLEDALEAAASVRASIHRAAWTADGTQVHRATVGGGAASIIDDPDAGLDDTRQVTLTVTMIHSET